MQIQPRHVKFEDCDFYHSYTLAGSDVGVLAAVMPYCRRRFDLLKGVAQRSRRTVIMTGVCGKPGHA